MGLGLAVLWRLSWAAAVPLAADASVWHRVKQQYAQVLAAFSVPGRWGGVLSPGELSQDMFPGLRWGCFCLINAVCFRGDGALTVGAD